MAQDSTRFFSLGGRGCVSATIGDRLALFQTIGEVLPKIAQDSWAIKPIMILKMRLSDQSYEENTRQSEEEKEDDFRDLVA